MSKSNTNSYGHRRKIHLYHQPRVTKSRGKIDYYSLATCYFEDGKNKKKTIQSIGELTKKEADQYRLLLKALNGKIDIGNLVDLDQVIYEDEKGYLDVLAMDALWKKLGLQKIFATALTKGQKISIEQVARVLTLNRILDPSSKIRTIPWLQSTLLPEIMGVDVNSYDKNKVFRSLSDIHKCKKKLEKLFLTFSQKQQKEFNIYYFDGSTSWFEGSKCNLAEFDLEKTRGFFSKVIGLMMLTDRQGYPVAWEIVNGHTKDTSAIKDFVRRVSEDYKIDKITYCFDRGVASSDNFNMISQAQSKYISGIRDNQIKDVFDINKFQKTRIKITDRITGNEVKAEKSNPSSRRHIVGIDNFFQFSKRVYFKDLGVIRGKRYIVSFNFEIFLKETRDRSARIDKFLTTVSQINFELENSKRDRDYNVTERNLIEAMKKYKVKEFFEYTLAPKTTSTNSQSFAIQCKIKKKKLDEAKLTDGLLVFVTNHMEQSSQSTFDLSARDIIGHYKSKYVIENSFRELKSFLELRPFYVWTESHVKAHYDIAVIAYFISNYVYRNLENLEVSLRQFHEQLAKAGKTVKIVSPSGGSVSKLKKPTQEIEQCMKSLGIPGILSPRLHKTHGVFQ